MLSFDYGTPIAKVKDGRYNIKLLVSKVKIKIKVEKRD